MVEPLPAAPKNKKAYLAVSPLIVLFFGQNITGLPVVSKNGGDDAYVFLSLLPKNNRFRQKNPKKIFFASAPTCA
jgi:hypothetical protein